MVSPGKCSMAKLLLPDPTTMLGLSVGPGEPIECSRSNNRIGGTADAGGATYILPIRGGQAGCLLKFRVQLTDPGNDDIRPASGDAVYLETRQAVEADVVHTPIPTIRSGMSETQPYNGFIIRQRHR